MEKNHVFKNGETFQKGIVCVKVNVVNVDGHELYSFSLPWDRETGFCVECDYIDILFQNDTQEMKKYLCRGVYAWLCCMSYMEEKDTRKFIRTHISEVLIMFGSTYEALLDGSGGYEENMKATTDFFEKHGFKKEQAIYNALLVGIEDTEDRVFFAPIKAVEELKKIK